MTANNPVNNILYGVTNGSTASAGQVGEVISAVVSAAGAVGIGSNTSSQVASISLTAGDWVIVGNSSLQAIGTAATGFWTWCSTSNSATAVDNSLRNGVNVSGLGAGTAVATPFFHLSVSATTTVYLMAYLGNSSGAGSACGGIFATRIR